MGYKGRGAPKDHPEYYFAERTKRLFLNLVDSNDPQYIPEIIINKAIDVISYNINEGLKVLVHCNQGESRSPIIGMLYLNAIGFFEDKNFNESEERFKHLYPYYNPANGVRTFALMNWNKYKNKVKE